MARCGASAAGAQSQQAQPASGLQMPPDLGTASPHARIVHSSGEPVRPASTRLPRRGSGRSAPISP